jgi:tRNA A-37 threonylcarbamoyl transferase component Bud32
MNPLTGTLIRDRYWIERELGRGGFGAVYLARDRQLMDRPVVIKVLLGEALENEWSRRKFSQEIEAMARIHHPGVVSVVDSGVLESGEPYMVQQFVEGSTLRDAIPSGGLEKQRAAGIIRKIGLALEAAHARGVVHRDLKPENIMLQPLPGGDEHVTLIDFGIASVGEDSGAPAEKTKVTGTFTYMAPEQFDGKPEAASDIYALGIIAFEMLTGSPPSAGKPLFELMMMQKEGRWPKVHELRSDLSPSVHNAITRALSYRTGERWGQASAMAESVAQALEVPVPDATTVEIPPPLEPETPTARRWWAIGGIALAAALVLWMVLPSERRATPPEPPPPAPAVRAFTYWITGQRYINNKPEGRPFVDAKETVYRTGDRINLEFEAALDGHLYVINQAPELRGGLPLYSILFPALGDTSSRVAARQYLRIPDGDQITFTGTPGLEYVWVVFSRSPIRAFEGLKPGEVAEAGRAKAILDFLRNQESARPLVETDGDSRRSVVRILRDPAILRMELSHR